MGPLSFRTHHKSKLCLMGSQSTSILNEAFQHPGSDYFAKQEMNQSNYLSQQQAWISNKRQANLCLNRELNRAEQ